MEAQIVKMNPHSNKVIRLIIRLLQPAEIIGNVDALAADQYVHIRGFSYLRVLSVSGSV